MREGGSNSLPPARRPNNHELVPDAIKAVTDNTALIEHTAPQCLNAGSVAVLSTCAAQIADIDRHQRRSDLHSVNLDAVESNVHAYAAERLTAIHVQLAPQMQLNRLLSDRLEPLQKLITAAGKASAEGRKKNEKLAEAAVNKKSEADKAATKDQTPPIVAHPSPPSLIITPTPAPKLN